MDAATTHHRPVLFDAVMEGLAPRPGGRYLDGTVGGGGHAAGLLAASAPDGLLLGLDRDPAALARAAARLAEYGRRLSLARASFAALDEAADEAGFDRFDGILLDLGLSSDQLDDPARGLSFQADGPLDMRLDPDGPVTAADLVNGLDATALADLIYRYGEEPASRRIARAIVAARPITGTRALAAVVAGAAGRSRRATHPATRTFQALRIAVNEELDALAAALPRAVGRLAGGGRLAVISFHSLEDRLVKESFRTAAAACICPPGLPECRCDHVPTLRLITRRPITPAPEEALANPRSRSAKLRVAERLAA